MGISVQGRKRIAIIAAMALGLLACGAQARNKDKHNSGDSTERQLLDERTGSAKTRAGLRLRLVTDTGNVRIHTHESKRVDYKVRLEAYAVDEKSRAAAERFIFTARTGPDGVTMRGAGGGTEGAIWVTIDVTVPAEYSVEVGTHAGNIETGDMHGHVTLTTGGGNIMAGEIHGVTRLETAGGHIRTKDVYGNLLAETGGGHITTGKVMGLATLRTEGGHIHVAMTARPARIETAGGNISLGQSLSDLVVDTGGGEIVVGEASGSVNAHTNGGAIRVVNLKGPTQLQTGEGSIYLTRVENAVRASTGAGGITAWMGNEGAALKPCELDSGDGDIDVHIPAGLPLTIDAQVSMANEHRIIVDPSFPVKVSYESGSRAMHAEGELNGGGQLLRLRTVSGNIRLLLSDARRQGELFKQQLQSIEKQLQVMEKEAPQAEAAAAAPKQN